MLQFFWVQIAVRPCRLQVLHLAIQACIDSITEHPRFNALMKGLLLKACCLKVVFVLTTAHRVQGEALNISGALALAVGKQIPPFFSLYSEKKLQFSLQDSI